MPRVTGRVVKQVVESAANDGTLATAIANNNAQLKKLQDRKMQLHKYYLAEPKVRVTISPFYRPHFGNTMLVGLNGLNIYVPCDGKGYEIPKSFADIVHERIMRVDDQVTRQNRMADIANNHERSIGELKLF